MIHIEHAHEADQDTKLCNCAACSRELLSPQTADELRRVPPPLWPPLARRLFCRGMTVHSRVRIGEDLRPFCAACVAAGRHETIRAGFEAKWYRRRSP